MATFFRSVRPDNHLTPLMNAEFYDKMKNVVVVIRTSSPSHSQPVAPTYNCTRSPDITYGNGIVIDDEGHVVTVAHVIPKDCNKIYVLFYDDDENWQNEASVGEYEYEKVPQRNPNPRLILLKPSTSYKRKKFAYARLGDENCVEVGMEAICLCHLTSLVYSQTVGSVAFPSVKDNYSDYASTPKTSVVSQSGGLKSNVPTERVFEHVVFGSEDWHTSCEPNLPLIQIYNTHSAFRAWGGPVFDSAGTVIGLLFFHEGSSDFAVHVSDVKKFCGPLIA